MLTYRRTSVLESTAQTLVNTVNCVGVMGKGIAKAFKDREPAMFAEYKQLCDAKMLAPGKLWLWRGAEHWVLNFPTKVHWRYPSKLEWIEAGLEKFVAEYANRKITEISFPRLGCGNGNLDWADVQPLMERYLGGLDIPVFIHDYSVDIGLPEHLERISEKLQEEPSAAATFDGFLRSLHRMAEIGGDRFVELGTDRPFSAAVVANGELSIQTPDLSLQLEEEDLRGIWVSLLSGLVTREKAGWAMATGAEPILTLLSILPEARPVEIAPQGRAAELAVELKPSARRSVAAPAPGQQELTWA